MKHIIIGIVLVALGLWGMLGWWESFGQVMRGLVPFGLLGFGALAVLSGYRHLGDPLEVEEPRPDAPPRAEA